MVIGGVIVVIYGVNFLCYVILVEYLRFLDLLDVKEGIIVLKIVVYVVDIVNGFLGVRDRDNVMVDVC